MCLKIKKYIDEQGISLFYICGKAQISISRLEAMLDGKQPITAEEYFIICAVLGVSLGFFI